MPKISFWELITSTTIKKICIPAIQRDYALGRHDKSINRNNFLAVLKKAVCTDEVLPLDFVYGVDNDTMFIPLDGQQRLTTLWLLHWYVAYKAGLLDSSDIKKTLMKFNYETRSSSSNFCKSLCNLPPNTLNSPLREWITQQTWFYHQYRQDPTITGMLNMIAGQETNDNNEEILADGLEIIFKDGECDYGAIWERLTTTKCIQFNKLYVNLDDSDELYVKMNARGKQLTDFENFKTELVHHVKNSDILGETEALDFAAKLDVQWTDIFWPNRWKEAQTGDISIDEIYFTFLNRFVRLECIRKQGDKSPLTKKISGNFTSFEPYKEILDRQSITDLITIMDNLRGNCLDVESPWGERFDFIPSYTNEDRNDISKITNTQTLLFYGYCRYLIAGKYDKETFGEWNRVLWNICENRVDKSNYEPTLNEIEILAPHSHDILSFLSQEKTIDSRYNKEQLMEEQNKARHLTAYPSIRTMEGFLFFKGTIRFLFTGADNNEDWASFEKKAENIKILIPEKRDERHTIRFLTPYLSKKALCEVYFHNWVSNNDDDLRSILLDNKAVPFIHNFLLQNEQKEVMTLLHKDVIELCESAFGGTGYLQIKWSDSKYVWTNYEKATKYHGWNSFVVGNEIYTWISQIIDGSDTFEIYGNQRNRRIGNHIQATFIHFKYMGHHFTLYGNNTICLMTENWEEKISNPENPDGYYFSVQDKKSEQQLIEQINSLLTEYNSKASTFIVST